MANLSNIVIATLLLVLSCSQELLAHDGIEHRRINDEFMLSYKVTNDSIWFEIEASTNGWVAIGFNGNVSSKEPMYGADFFIGGVTSGNQTYGNDYFLPTNSSLPKRPILDTLLNGTNDWKVINGTEFKNATTNVTKTIIQFSRLLNTGDKDHDLILEDKSISLLWSYNNASDSVADGHSHNGYISANLLSGAPNPVSVGIGTLLVALVAALTSKQSF